MSKSIWEINNPVEYECNRLVKKALFFTAVFFFCIVLLLAGILFCSLWDSKTSMEAYLLSFAGLITIGCGYVIVLITEQQFKHIFDDGKIINT